MSDALKNGGVRFVRKIKSVVSTLLCSGFFVSFMSPTMFLRSYAVKSRTIFD